MDNQPQDNITTNTIYKLQLNMKMKAAPRGKWHIFKCHTYLKRPAK